MKMVPIEGNTYPIRNQLKALGAKWNPDTKAWYIPEDKIEQANAFVAAASQKEEKKRKPIHARCPTCGTEFEV